MSQCTFPPLCSLLHDQMGLPAVHLHQETHKTLILCGLQRSLPLSAGTWTRLCGSCRPRSLCGSMERCVTALAAFASVAARVLLSCSSDSSLGGQHVLRVFAGQVLPRQPLQPNSTAAVKRTWALLIMHPDLHSTLSAVCALLTSSLTGAPCTAAQHIGFADGYKADLRSMLLAGVPC